MSCFRCGSDLRGLPAYHDCPKCGAPVWRSLPVRYLGLCDPDWVLMLSRGTKWVLVSVVLSVLLALIKNGFESLEGSGRTTSYVGVGFAAVLSAIPMLIWVKGIWHITTPESRVIRESGLPLGVVLRWASVLSLVVSLVNIGSALARQDLRPYIEAVGILSGVVGFLALFFLLRRLALRLPNDRLARQTQWVMWGLLTSLAVLLCMEALEDMTNLTEQARQVLAFPACLVIAGLLVFGAWLLLLLLRYYMAFFVATRFARFTKSCADTKPSQIMR